MGIVIKPEVAFRMCHGYKLDGELILWSDGVVGTLTDEQEKLCKSIILHRTIPESLKKRLKSFREVSKRCSEEVKKYPKGQRLIPFLQCMGREAKELEGVI